MTDRELLELAAKAAGIGPLDFDYATREGHGFYFGPRLPMPQGVFMAATWTYWDPITNDADALRLAVKLRLHVDTWDGFVQVFHESGGVSETFYGSDSYAATRRAIVRAAAELGARP